MTQKKREREKKQATFDRYLSSHLSSNTTKKEKKQELLVIQQKKNENKRTKRTQQINKYFDCKFV